MNIEFEIQESTKINGVYILSPSMSQDAEEIYGLLF